MNVVLISSYDWGHQPFGIVSPATWLIEETEANVFSIDLGVERLEGVNEERIAEDGLIAYYVPTAHGDPDGHEHPAQNPPG